MRSVIKAAATFAVLALLPSVTTAEEAISAADELRPTVSILYSHTFADDDRDTRDGKGVSLAGGFALDRYFGLELSGFFSEFRADGVNAVSNRESGLKIDGQFFYSRNRSFSPYFGIGLGGVRTERGDEGETAPFTDAGFGFLKFFALGNFDMGVRADLRYRWIFNDEDAFGGAVSREWHEPVMRVGLVFPLGQKAVVHNSEQEKICADADGDGVCDEADLCAGTARGTPVDAKGCAANSADILGGGDRKFEDVRFAFDNAELTDYSKGVLDEASRTINELLKKFPDLKVDLSGHTDWVGTEGYNQALSERRANIVKEFLVRKRVPAGILSTYAYGETKPIAPNETEEGRALNRRAEVRSRTE